MMPVGICGAINSPISFARSSQRVDAEREAHAGVRAVDVRGDRHVVASGALEQQRRPAVRRLADAVGHGGDFEVGAHRVGDARQQLALVEVGEEVVEVGIHATG
jgi:hypothetical protein